MDEEINLKLSLPCSEERKKQDLLSKVVLEFPEKIAQLHLIVVYIYMYQLLLMGDLLFSE